MIEIHSRINLGTSIGEIIYPAGLIGIDRYDVCVEKIVFAAKRTRNGFADDIAAFVYESRVFRYHHYGVGVYLDVRIQIALCGLELMLAQSCRTIIVDFVPIDHLIRIELSIMSDGIGIVNAVDGSYFFFGSPLFGRNRFAPIQMRSYGFAELILGNLVFFVAAVCRIGQTFADDGIPNVVDKLAVLGIGDLRPIHPKSIHRYRARFGRYAP